jgi:hypothetical protein
LVLGSGFFAVWGAEESQSQPFPLSDSLGKVTATSSIKENLYFMGFSKLVFITSNRVDTLFSSHQNTRAIQEHVTLDAGAYCSRRAGLTLGSGGAECQ